MDLSPLSRIGLTRAEIDVYLALLKQGSAPASILAARAGVNRSHVYDKLSNLKQKGLVSEVTRDNVAWFHAGPPEKLLDYLDEVQEDMRGIIPDLSQMKESAGQASVELFQGKEGVKTVFRDVLREEEDYYVLGEEGRFQKLFPVYIRQFLRDVHLLGLKEHLLSKEAMRGKIEVTQNTAVRYLPDKYFSPVMMAIYGEKVAIWIWAEPMFTILVRSADVARSFKTYFDILWEVGRK